MTYQVGDIQSIKDEDPMFTSEEAAYKHAFALLEGSDEVFIGIWTGQDEGSELLAIIYCGEAYCK